MCGRGTGLDDDGRRAQGRGRRAAALERQTPARRRRVGVLAAVGGFEIAFLAGVALGAPPSERLVVLLDGFITGAAALVAARLDPRAPTC